MTCMFRRLTEEYKWLPTAPGVCSLLYVCMLDGLNAYGAKIMQSTSSKYGSPYLAVCMSLHFSIK